LFALPHTPLVPEEQSALEEQVLLQDEEVLPTETQEFPEHSLWLPPTAGLEQKELNVPGLKHESFVQELPSLQSLLELHAGVPQE